MLAWHPEVMALLVIEVKSIVPDVQATIFGLDRKARLAPILVRDRGWEPTIVGRLLVIGDSSTSRARIAAHEFVFARALPDRGSRVRRWLREPLDPMAGIQFVRNVLPDRRTERFAGRERVRAR